MTLEPPKEKSWWQDWGDTVDTFNLRPIPITPIAPVPPVVVPPILLVEPRIHDFIIFSSSVTDIFYVRV